MYETLSYAARDGIGTLTLDRSDRLNALNQLMARELMRAIDAARSDPTLRVLIVTGAGRVFCAGADIGTLSQLDGADQRYRFLESLQSAFDALESLPVPTIAAINGDAYGGGCELAIACDFRIMSADARIGVPEIKLGLLPGAGGTQRLSRLLPLPLAKRMIMLGEALDASDAFAHGLVYSVVTGSQVFDAAQTLARRICALAPLALRSAKLLVHGAALDGLASGIEAERHAVAYLFQTDDAQEGLAAFLAKRTPEFTGR